MYLWMRVTTDEYELPEAVADSADKLAKMCGVKAMTIYSSLSHYEHGRIAKTPYRRIRVDDD